MNINNKPSPFCGRNKDLQHLIEAWQLAKTGKPQVVTLLGESGSGKTRLVQEFYNWLSTNEDGIEEKGYWPDVLAVDGENLRINPEPEECNLNNPRNYLWWGVRSPNTFGRNTTHPNATKVAERFLAPHIESDLHASRRKKYYKETGRAVGLEFVKSGVGMLGLGVIWNVIEYGGGVVKKIIEKPVSTKNVVKEGVKHTSYSILEHLKLVLKPEGKKTKPLPSVVVFDDAHYASELTQSNGQKTKPDPTLCLLILSMLKEALPKQWPILIVITHWTQEWENTKDLKENSVAHSLFEQCNKYIKDWQPYHLKRLQVDRLKPILKLTLHDKKNLLFV